MFLVIEVLIIAMVTSTSNSTIGTCRRLDGKGRAMFRLQILLAQFQYLHQASAMRNTGFGF